MFGDIQEYLQNQALVHLISRDHIIDAQQANFNRQLTRLTEKQRDFWVNGQIPTQLKDLQDAPLHTSHDIIQTQKNNPPYGILSPGELLFMSSGSTGGERVRYYHSWDTWMEMNIGAARNLLMHGVGTNDHVMTMDVGNMQLGYRHTEDAASFICGAKIIKSGQTTWAEKINLIRDYGVTVLVANTSKLLRMAKILDQPEKVAGLRMILQIGEVLTLETREYLQQKFNVSTVVDGYGCAEMGLITFTCPHGHQHINEDLVNFSERNNHGVLTRLVGAPLFNLTTVERLKYSYKGQCDCGSFLSTVDEFIPRNNAIYSKE
jgi:phenylacetate-coenzyme A ligase PaaK-like adenylate-forming protein